VAGVTSPYPTVVIVTSPHHIASGMLEKASGWTSPSRKYIVLETATRRTASTTSTAPSSDRRA